MDRARGAAFVIAGLCACRSAPEESPASVERAVHETLAAQASAWNDGDVEGFLAGYRRAPDTTFLSRGPSALSLTRGFEAMASRFRSSYPAGKQGRLEFANLEVRPLGADAAWVLGRFTLTGEVEQSGAFTLVLRRFGDRFLIVHDHTSADAPGAATRPR